MSVSIYPQFNAGVFFPVKRVNVFKLNLCQVFEGQGLLLISYHTAVLQALEDCFH